MSSRQRPRCLRSSLTSVAFSRLWGLCASQMMSQRTIQGGKRARFSAGNLARFWFLPFSGRKLICTGATGINQRFAQWRHRQRHRNADPPARQNRRKKHPHCRHPPLRPTTPPIASHRKKTRRFLHVANALSENRACKIGQSPAMLNPVECILTLDTHATRSRLKFPAVGCQIIARNDVFCFQSLRNPASLCVF